MAADWPSVPILTYHSISAAAGPAAIAPPVFTRQLDVLVDRGFVVVPLSAVVDAMITARPLPPRACAITFDDAYDDFADVAWKELQQRGQTATVFVPTGHVGGEACWEGSPPGAGRVMSWNTLRRLSDDGVEFGSHGVSHRDLTRIADPEVRDELVDSRRLLEEQLATSVNLFAMPYGATNRAVRRRVEEVYEAAVGVRLRQADYDADRYDLPRLDMHYFRDPRRWSRFLEGRAKAWFAARRALRKLRALVS